MQFVSFITLVYAARLSKIWQTLQESCQDSIYKGLILNRTADDLARLARHSSVKFAFFAFLVFVIARYWINAVFYCQTVALYIQL